MPNAIEPSTVMPVRQHTMTSEDVVVLRGRAEEVLFEADGTVILRSLESVIIESKNGKFNPASEKEYLNN